MLGLGLGFGGARAASWVPTSLPGGVFLWLRADLGTAEAGGAGTGVSAWNDQSGNGDANRNFAQPTAGRRPVLNSSDAALGGQKSLGGGATKSLVSGTWTTLTQPFTIAWSGIASTAVEQVLCQATPENLFIESMVTAKTPWGFAGASGLQSPSGDCTTKHVGVAVFNGASSKLYFNSTTATVTANAGTNNLSGLFLMNVADGGSLPWLGSLHEFVVKSGALSGSDLATLMNYMGDRIGQTIS